MAKDVDKYYKRTMKKFNPNEASQENFGVFGLPFKEHNSQLILIPVPWDATVSYGLGTSRGPNAIFAASKQIDLFDTEFGNFYKKGIFMKNEDSEILKWNRKGRIHARRVIKTVVNQQLHLNAATSIKLVNTLSKKLNEKIYETTKKYLLAKKKVGVIGGDHSCAFGAIQAITEHFPDVGILQIDAHADLRDSFENFEHSHACIMFNVIKTLPIKKLVQVGLRDICEDEYRFIARKKNIKAFFDKDIFEKKSNGTRWSLICKEIISELPDMVYISFDIDGLDPTLCPHTGTPVPGGLQFNEILMLLNEIPKYGKQVIGFDLSEVAPGKDGEWDGNVGSRILYKLCAVALQESR